MGGPFGVSIITARALGPEDRGLYFLAVSFAQIAAQIGNVGLQSSNTFLVAAHPERVRAILTNSLIVSLVFGPLAAWPIVWWFGFDTTPEAWSSILLAVVLAPLVILFLLVSNIAVAIGRVTLYNLLIILSGMLALGCASVAALMGANTTQFLWAAAAGLTLASLIGILALMPNCHWSLRPSLALFRSGVSYSIRAYLATLAGFLMNRVGILVLESHADLTVVGQFSIAQQISEALVLLPSTVGLLLKPSLLRMPTRVTRAAETRKIALRLAAAMAVFLLLIGVATPVFLPLIFGEVYQPAVPFLLALLPSVFLLSVVIVVSQFLSAEGFPAAQVLIWMIATAIHGSMTAILVPQFGAMAIPISFMVNTALVLLGLILAAIYIIRRERSDA
jgi:O-antigen/teichoic acid export membrane protein